MKICVAAKYLGLMVWRYLCFRVFFGRSIKGKNGMTDICKRLFKAFLYTSRSRYEVLYFE